MWVSLCVALSGTTYLSVSSFVRRMRIEGVNFPSNIENIKKNLGVEDSNFTRCKAFVFYHYNSCLLVLYKDLYYI
jgi:hypothetical protein